MREEFIEKIYAGWLAKIIGIRLGAPIEGWTYDKIKNIYGELTGYPVDYTRFAADDDSNGPLFFLRALEDKGGNLDLKAQDVGEALLNYAPFEHGFFWWGGYGVSTEHTAYLNLRNGIKAPQSGSIEQNGSTMAEQIGGQIFIDTWGLVTPGNPDLAARFAREAASVTHDGNGKYGGIFIAVCISYAFIEKNMKKILEKGLSYIPQDCEYTKVVRCVMEFYGERRQEGWRACYEYIRENFGYDKYPGNCHIIPNIGVMILALLYGEGDFSDTLNICNMCGWDTDCNVGNVAAIMGVRNGLEAIDYDKWRKPINDFLACSSVIGSLNLMDIPYGALYIAHLAYAIAGEEMPMPWKEIARQRIDSCHFEFPGSTHAMCLRVEGLDERARKEREWRLENTRERAFTGKGSLKILAKPVEPGENVYVYKKTYYRPQDFDDSRYDPAFSPTAYPGQTLYGSAWLPAYAPEALVSLYVKEGHRGQIYESPKILMEKEKWASLTYEIPSIEGGMIEEIGFCFHVKGQHKEVFDFTAMVDDLYVQGSPDYSIEFREEKEEVWTGLHREISQFTKLKGLAYLDDGQVQLSCGDMGALYTGGYNWKDYKATFSITPITGKNHYVNVRVQGAIRSYGAGLLPGGKAAILKNENGFRILKETDFPWEENQEYEIEVTVCGNKITAVFNGETKLRAEDEEHPYEKGGIGLSVESGSHISCRRIVISRK